MQALCEQSLSSSLGKGFRDLGFRDLGFRDLGFRGFRV